MRTGRATVAVMPDRPRRRVRWFAPLIVVVLVAAGATAWWLTRPSDESATPAAPGADAGVQLLTEPYPLLDTLAVPMEGTTDGRLDPNSTAVLEGSWIGVPEGGSMIVELSGTGSDERGVVTVYPCGTRAPAAGTLVVEPGTTTTQQVVATAGEGGRVCVRSSVDVNVVAEAIGLVGAGAFDGRSISVLATDGDTVDGEQADIGRLDAGDTVEVPLVGRAGLTVAARAMVVLSVETAGDEAAGVVTVRSCDAEVGLTVAVEPGEVHARPTIVPVGANGSVCVDASAATDLTIELVGVFEAALARAFEDPVRVVDTRAGGVTIDDRYVAIGVRPESTTLAVPLTDRLGAPTGAIAAVIDVTADGALEPGQLDVFAPGHATGRNGSLHYGPGIVGAGTLIVPLGASGEVCVANTGRTDVVVDVLGWLVASAGTAPATTVTGVTPTSTTAPASPAGGAGCPDQTLFPDRRMIAMYGTDRTPRLGVLGEQDAQAAAARLAEIAAPWRAGDRPVLPAFELIATLATADDGDDGLHRLRSSPEVVQEYLDVARRHGYYLILDLQPGWSDFLTEAKYYEEFLRQPDVGLALDPEWRTQRPRPPQGGFVGQTDAAEVNAVIEWLAGIVAEEQLPEKLLVVHQFQERMVLDRDQLIEPPGIALTIHMDGFGTRGQKQHTWSLLKVGPPWSNGLKLFYDEDIDRYRPDEILAGAFDPIPDLITYQ